MKKSDSINNYNFLKEESNKLIKSLPLDKLSKKDIDNIINITIYSNKKYLNLPQKYKECIKTYINVLIEKVN